MNAGKRTDAVTNKLLLSLQEGMPISAYPYRSLAEELGLSEDEVINRVRQLKRRGLLKRVGLSLNTQKLGLASTLVACRIPKKEIARVKQLINACGNITHNYLRKHRLNMWFTVSAASERKLNDTVMMLKKKMTAKEMVSLPTQKVFKLRFRLHAV